MSYPLEPLKGNPGADALMEHFLDYVAANGLELYPAQEEAILEVFEGNNVILNTPTGSGKSLVAAAMHFYSASRGRRSVYTCPIKALVNEKFLSLCRAFGPNNVGMMTGDASVNRDAPILCCTAEILSNIAARDGEKAAVNDVIMDEFHYYSDHDRGVAWQVPLLTLPQSRFLLISATLGETHFFAREIEKLTGQTCTIVTSQDRPVPLEFSYWEYTLTEALEKLKDKQQLPVYIVHFTQRAASETAQNVIGVNVCSKAEKVQIDEELQDVKFSSPFGKEIRKLLRNGIGLHHAGLLPKYRVLVEKLAQKGLLKLICGTDTLGVGVNVPIRTVLFTQLSKYGGKKTATLTARDFHQISGRAGRKGFDDVGYVVCLAPEHVVQNKRMEAKAATDPKKKKKLVKKKPPERGFVGWNEETFDRLQKAKPESLISRFQVSHGMLLNVLSREGDGCMAMRQLIRDCHETDSSKQSLRKMAFQLFRSLVDRSIVEILPKESGEQKLRVNVELQDDFSLNQTLALYCIDTLALLDQEDPEYALKLLSLVESILEDPAIILRRQLDELKTEKMGEMRAAGIEYEERIEKLDELEYPKPERDFIYETYNEFARVHPWVGKENIRPKSIAREMYEKYCSFADYVKEYGLKRSEGLLLRHLTSVYRVLENTIPPVFRNESVDEVVQYLDLLIRSTDSSLLDEWEHLRDPNYVPTETDVIPHAENRPTDITRDPKAFKKQVRQEIYQFMRVLANKDYVELHETYDISKIVEIEDASRTPIPMVFEQRMKDYYETRGWIRLDPVARAAENTRFDTETGSEYGFWIVEQTLVDSEELNDWVLTVKVDLQASRNSHEVKMSIEALTQADN